VLKHLAEHIASEASVVVLRSAPPALKT
jgi:hypothetical protein